MKRLLTLAAMFLCCMATSFAQFTGSGSGTESDPYLILNPIQLNQLRNYLNTEGVYFKLMADIDLAEYLEDENPDQGWQPVGNSSSAAFKGILDGNGKTISGLWINRSSNDKIGLFGYTSKATVKNLVIVANTIAGENNVGGISGYSDNSTFSNVSFSGKIQGASYVGGIIGGSGDNLTMTDITANAEVTASGDYVGGLIGKNDAGNNLNVSGCHVNSSKISGNNYVGGACGGSVSSHSTTNSLSSCYIYADVMGKERVGGICGFSENSYHTVNLNNCGFVGNVNGKINVGGLVGFINKTGIGYNNDTQNNCFAIGYVTATGDYAGGLIGYDKGYHYSNGRYDYYLKNNVSNSYFSGTVSGKNYTAGLVGYKKNGTVSNCYSTASIAGAKYVGGLVGYNDDFTTTIKTSVAINTRVTATEGEVGRIVGFNYYGSIPEIGATDENKSYNRTIVISQGVAQDIIDDQQNGTGVSFTTLKLKATYVAMGWDFTNSWEIQETECYPYFKTQTAPPVITSQLVSRATMISGKCVDGGNVTLEVDGTRQQMVSSGHQFSFSVSPLQAGHDVRLSAKADGKEPSYYTTETVSYLGKGTASDPYQIYTPADLTGVYRKGYFKLMNDIDLTDYINQFSPTEGWESIGREGSETIHFDGDGHKITGLWCNTTRDNTGLFSCFANGEIKNLTVEVANGKQIKGGTNTGIIIGKMINGTIENCKVAGKVADGTPVGGIIGLLAGGSISKSQANVTINTTETNSYVGGIVGEITSGTIDKCVTTGTLTATGTESYVGGLIGKNSATVTNSYSTATIASSYNAAGIVAYNYGVVDMCYTTGNLYSNNYAAGVIGYNDGANAIVRNCVAMNNKIEVTYESQQVQQGGGYGQRIIGGIKNNAPAPDMNNYALKTMQVSLNDVPQKVYDDIMNGTAKTSTELKEKATYQELDWDFDNVWQIDEDESYPYQTVKVDGGSAPEDPNTPDNPDNPQGEIEVTDVSSINNVVYIESMEEMCGTQATISLKMKNTAAIRGFQFDLYLPEGMTVVKSSKGKIQGALSEGRLPDEDEHSLTFSEQADRSIRFLCSSQYDETFTGNDGEIATLRVNIANDMADGNYPLLLKNIKLTETDISKYYETPLVKCKLTIKSYILGDINSDGVVDVSDYTGVANHIHGNTPEGFVVKAGDVDGSGTIDVSDYTGIANIIHTGSIYGSNASRAILRSPKKVNTDISSKNNIVYIDPFDVSAGEQTTLSIKMKNSAAIRGFQFDLYLPEGITAAKSNKGRILGALNAGRLPDEDGHELTFSEQPDGSIRFLCSSQYDETFTGTDGEIATLTISIDAAVEAQDYPIYLRNMKLTETDISQYYTTNEIETSVTVTGPADGRVVLRETATSLPVVDETEEVDVVVYRTLKAGEWSTICLPFDMDEDQMKEFFGDEVQLAKYQNYSATKTGSDVTGISISFSTVDLADEGFEANVPYMIKPSKTEDITSFELTTYVIPDDIKTGSTKKGWFYGTYEAETVVPANSLFLNGNKFYYSTGKTKMKAFRAYLTLPVVLADVANANSRIALSFDDATDVKELKSSRIEELKSYYNLKGQRVEKPVKKGLYIQNGKKVVIK